MTDEQMIASLKKIQGSWVRICLAQSFDSLATLLIHELKRELMASQILVYFRIQSGPLTLFGHHGFINEKPPHLGAKIRQDHLTLPLYASGKEAGQVVVIGIKELREDQSYFFELLSQAIGIRLLGIAHERSREQNASSPTKDDEILRLSEQNLRLQKDLISQKKFISHLTHEMKTPLQVMVGLQDLLLDQNPTPDQAEKLSVLGTTTQGLLHLVQDTLDLIKLKEHDIKLDLIPFDLVTLVQEVGELFCAYDGSVGALVVMPDDLFPHRLGDGARLKQVLMNLVGNAIKFSDGPVTIEIKEAMHDKILFSVADLGPGIQEGDRALIFEEFTQLDPPKGRRNRGSGLGLAISQQIIELMGSQIKVESNAPHGSIFSFSLHLPLADHKTSPLNPDPFKAQILVVEDSEDSHLLFKAYFQKPPYEVNLAENGQVAVNLFQSNSFDLVFMDLHMPALDGKEAIVAMRDWEAMKRKGRTKVIALTADALSHPKEELLELGFDDKLLKPVSKDLLLTYTKQSLWASRCP